MLFTIFFLIVSFNSAIFFNFILLISSLGSLIKYLNKEDFKYLSQEFDTKLLDLVNVSMFLRFRIDLK